MWITILLYGDLKGTVDTIYHALYLTAHMPRSISKKLSLAAVVFTYVLPIFSSTVSNKMYIITTITTNTFLA